MEVVIKFRHFIKLKIYGVLFFQRMALDRIRRRSIVHGKIKNFPQFKNAEKDLVYLKESKLFLKRNFSGYKNTTWHFYYATLNQIKSVQYIPDEIFFSKIEPTLNNYRLLDAYSDKISFDLFFDKAELPETVYKLMNGKFYDSENNFVDYTVAVNKLLLMGEEKLVLKPAIITGGGNGVVVDNGKKIPGLILDKKYARGSYIIQKFVSQHPEMAKFHPHSLNTCRIMTAKVGSEIVVLSAILRVGRNNSMVDNIQAGGLMCKINPDGNLAEYAIDPQVNRFEKHPDTGAIFKGCKIPNYDKALAFCLAKHKKFLRFTFISWDIGIKENGEPVFIEFNLSKQAINAHQIFVGPLFGKYTDDLLKRYREERKKSLYFLEK